MPQIGKDLNKVCYSFIHSFSNEDCKGSFIFICVFYYYFILIKSILWDLQSDASFRHVSVVGQNTM